MHIVVHSWLLHNAGLLSWLRILLVVASAGPAARWPEPGLGSGLEGWECCAPGGARGAQACAE